MVVTVPTIKRRETLQVGDLGNILFLLMMIAGAINTVVALFYY
ncbi:MAG TPA: hypothetical protein VIR29_03475 [Anseongella sp.]